MHRTRALAALAAASLLTLPALAQDKPQPGPAKKPAAAKDVDLKPWLEKINAAPYPAPPSTFRKGHVSPRLLAKGALTQSQTGFAIQLPSKAPLPTPAYADGKLYVSGGFHSKEFYCFDAATGALVWGVTLDDDGPSSAVLADGVVVFNTESCTTFALDAKTGAQLWSHWLGDPLTSTPTIAKGRVFTSYPAAGRCQGGQKLQQAPSSKPAAKTGAPTSHVLCCLELKTGKILWQKWIDSDVMSAPIAVGDDLYASTFAGTLLRLRQSDGAILSATRSRATSAPLVIGGEVFGTQRADKGKQKAQESIVAIGRDKKKRFEAGKRRAEYLDGAVQSRSKLERTSQGLDAANGFASQPEAANWRAAYANVGQGRVSALQAFQGSRGCGYGAWNFHTMGDEVVCIDRRSGKTTWKLALKGDLKKAGGFLGSPPASAGDRLFLTTLEGEVLQVEPQSGKIEKRYKIGAPLRSQPIIVDGRIYVGTQTGKLVAIDTGDKALTGWSMWGGDAAHSGARETEEKKAR